MQDEQSITTINRQDEAMQLIVSQTTPRKEIRWRDGKGGRKLPYTDTAYVIRLLNEAFRWGWDFIVDNEEVLYNGDRPFEVKVRGKLIIRFGEHEIIKTQFGCQPIEWLRDGSAPVSLGDAYKGAASDALKKCASLLGVALDLYDSDSDINTGKGSGVRGQGSGETATNRPPTPVTRPPSSTDPMTRFWSEVKAAGMDRQQGTKILAGANNDPSRAVDVLLGIAQEAA